ncbi:cytochrome P450 2K6-like isoform X1 [Alligator sinensis]|uniref:Cytochrome P450 2K6-like isoform X1 n=1 Tax=Alligator sinensis TaxID=38654 RepID=A0A3Q0GR92_ALLSI|nr:cytochrome P450 2K6-like isoform X1 [Alligator sinensis]
MDWPDPIFIFLGFILTVLSIMKIGSFWNSSIREDFPPGPRPLPIIGNLHIIDLKRPYRTLLKLSETYGPIFSIQMGFTKMVVLSDYETVKEALVNQADAFAERPKVPVFEDFSNGYGITFSHGENWKVMRRFTLTTLRDFGMGKRAIEDQIVEECEHLIKSLESQKGKPFEPTITMNAAVANIIISILLGERFDYEDPRFIRLLHLIHENARLLGLPSVQIYNLFPALGFLLKGHKTVLRNRDELHAFIKVVFIERFKKLDKNDQRSFIDAFLVRQQELIMWQINPLCTHASADCMEPEVQPDSPTAWRGKGREAWREKSDTNVYFHNDNLKSLVSNLFAAGMETTYTTLRWGILLMMKYPEIQQKVQDEIMTVLGSNPPRIKHRTKMPYTDAVVHEIQRTANILPLSAPHMTTVDVTLKGYFIAKGTYIIPFLGSVLKDKSQWEKPDTFYPEHFLDSEGKFVKKEAFLPFSAGRRICAGETLAKMELFLFFTSLLQRFTFQPALGLSTSDLDLTPAAGLRRAPMPHEICAVPRA